ncbi:50S ribosomal protein L24 [Methanomassiliicoccus luminyensis]|uniref:50S ribosomal protein L24 n=1 Tax=Methanomassiliicoccus luminyensis TaxID=1080712 RepID=UPI000364E03A|nr:50S ribosomal protein L24 [Methanomassiliicoccus luminyensis]
MVESKKARKQRKAFYNAPVHVRRKMVASHLSDDLRKEYKVRSTQVIKGDTVKVMRGDEDINGVEGRVTEVITKTGRVVVEGVTTAKADGTQVARPVHASKVMIMKLDLSDGKRKDKLTKAKEVSQ